MSIAIIVRAQDPASCAEFLRALGLSLEAPNHTHPDAWRGFLNIGIEITRGESSQLALSIGTTNALDLARGLAEKGGKLDFAGVKSDPPIIVATGPNGERVVIEERDEPTFRPSLDEGMFGHVRLWLDPHVGEVRRLLEAAGGTNPRILGPVATGGRIGQDFSLVVDGPLELDLENLRAFIASVRSGPIGLNIRLSRDLPDADTAYLDRIAFPL